MKSSKNKIKEGRCQGIGESYVPFYTANEARSIGTASMIPDPIEHRMVHVLSTTEEDLYYLLRWDDRTLYIREQYLLNTERINDIRRQLGLKQCPQTTCYTTDFLVDHIDGTQHAYSVKWKMDAFNPNSVQYKGKKNRYAQMIERQKIEQLYWESQGIPFSIITSEHINRTLSKNINFVMGFYEPTFISTREQKLMYLIAHKIVEINMEETLINPKQLTESMCFDIDSMYEKALSMKTERVGEHND